MIINSCIISALLFLLVAFSNQPIEHEQPKIAVLKIDSINEPKSLEVIDTIQVNTSTIPATQLVTGRVVFTNPYCGGAWISQENSEGYSQEYDLKNSTILLKNSRHQNESINLSTDKHGKFSTTLAPGTYNYYMTKKYSKTMGAIFDASCKIWLDQCFGQITIKEKNTKAHKIIFNFDCNPCEPNNRP